MTKHKNSRWKIFRGEDDNKAAHEEKKLKKKKKKNIDTTLKGVNFSN